MKKKRFISISRKNLLLKLNLNWKVKLFTRMRLIIGFYRPHLCPGRFIVPGRKEVSSSFQKTILFPVYCSGVNHDGGNFRAARDPEAYHTTILHAIKTSRHPEWVFYDLKSLLQQNDIFFFFLVASLLIAQSRYFSNFQAYHYWLLCSITSSKGFPAIHTI